MPASFMKKTMAYLGLVDDDYDDYEDYESRSPAPVGRVGRAAGAVTGLPLAGDRTARGLERGPGSRGKAVQVLGRESRRERPLAGDVPCAVRRDHAGQRQQYDRSSRVASR